MTNTLRALGDETRFLTVEGITEKTRNISDREKKYLFNYLREGDIPENFRQVSNDPAANLRINEPIESYQTCVFIIVESFFTYSFIPALLESQAAKEARASGYFIEAFKESLSSTNSVSADEDYQEAQ